MSKKKEKGDVKAKSIAELQERAVSRLNSWNFESDKTGDVGKFHYTYIIHISKFIRSCCN